MTDEREESRFRRLVDTLDHAVVWEFDETVDAYTFVSQHSKLVLGFECEDWLKDPHFFERHVHPEDLPKLKELLAKLRRRETADLRCEHRCQRADGSLLWVHTGVHFEVRDGHEIYQGVTIDIHHIKTAEAQQRAAREEAERAGKARDEVLAVVAHDLRNPLNTIRLTVAVLEQVLGKKNETAVILRAVDRMQSLIEDLVDAASIRASRMKISRARVDASTLLRQLADDFSGEASERGIRLEVKASDSVEVEVDGRRITQAMSNLIHNALKFTEKGGTVTLAVKSDPLHATFTVRDTGRGIAEADISKVFDREWQADETAHLGSGMGLYIAKGIVSAHGGDIAVASTPGAGSLFTVTLPMP